MMEPRAPLALPAREQTSSRLQSSRSVQNRERAMGWGNEPVCRLGASFPPRLGDPDGRQHGPISLLMLTYSQHKSLLRLQSACGMSSLPTLGRRAPSPTPYLQGRDSAVSSLSFYSASARLVCHPSQRPPSPPSSTTSRPLRVVPDLWRAPSG